MSSSGTRASWDTEKDKYLIEAMTDQARAGKRSDSGFKKEAWVAVTKEINDKFGLQLVKQQIKSRLQMLKGKYTAVSDMLSASGFGWDAERNVVLVHDDVWNDYVTGHPKCIDFRRTPLPYYDDLKELFEGTYATGDHAIASDEPSPTDFVTGPNAPTAPSVATVDETDTPAAATLPASSRQQGESHQTSKKRSRESGGVMIADAIKEIAGEMHSRNVRLKVLLPSQKAVRILQTTYGDRFVAAKMAAAFDIMLDERKAQLFVVMEEGDVRDIWLENQLQQQE